MWTRLSRWLVSAYTTTAIDDLVTGLAYCYFANIVVLIGLLFGRSVIAQGKPELQPRDSVSACIRFDGWHYHSIALNGYNYNPEKRSTVAFFPAYPLMSRWLASAVVIRIEDALLLVSNAFLSVAFCLMAQYARLRAVPMWPNQVGWTLLAFGLWPSSFFSEWPLLKVSS
jgi:hypothetical protein